MKKILILILAITALISCSKDDDTHNSSDLRLRISNVSEFDFSNVIVNTSTGEVIFEDINSGQNTDYQKFELAYRYAFIELEIDGNTFTLQPIDYVGETPLENGDYTYEIDANNSLDQYGRLSLTLVEE